MASTNNTSIMSNMSSKPSYCLLRNINNRIVNVDVVHTCRVADKAYLAMHMHSFSTGFCMLSCTSWARILLYRVSTENFTEKTQTEAIPVDFKHSLYIVSAQSLLNKWGKI